MPATAQNYANHARYVPGYHFACFGILAINLLYRGYALYRSPSFAGVMDLLVGAALILLFFYARLFALAVQDRVIRNEERERLARLLSEPLRSRLGELSVRQLVALRFASDAELPALVQEALEGRLASPDAIKRRIQSWRADHQRA